MEEIREDLDCDQGGIYDQLLVFNDRLRRSLQFIWTRDLDDERGNICSLCSQVALPNE